MTEPKILVFDTETSGIDVFNDRVIQAVISVCDGLGGPLETWEWIIDPGVEIPEEASNVHGMTTEWLQEHGQDPVGALASILDIFDKHPDLTWIAFNMNFDLSLLNEEFKRHELHDDWYGEIQSREVKLFDPLVVDRAKDRYRKGPRKLLFQAEHYGVPVIADKLHDADYDVEITAKVAVAIARRYGVPSNTEQAQMYADWAEGFEKYLKKTDPDATIDRAWPVRLKGN